MAEHNRIQIIENIKKCTYFSLEANESRNISKNFQLVAFEEYDTKPGTSGDILSVSHQRPIRLQNVYLLLLCKVLKSIFYIYW